MEVLRNSSALSASLAVASDTAPFFFSTVLSSTISAELVTLAKKALSAADSVMVTVDGSVATMFVAPSSTNATEPWMFFSRSNEKTTSSAVIVLPVENLASVLSLKTYVRPSSLTVHDAARAGRIFVGVAGSMVTSGSPQKGCNRPLMSAKALGGSRVARSAIEAAILSSPLGALG